MECAWCVTNAYTEYCLLQRRHSIKRWRGETHRSDDYLYNKIGFRLSLVSSCTVSRMSLCHLDTNTTTGDALRSRNGGLMSLSVIIKFEPISIYFRYCVVTPTWHVYTVLHGLCTQVCMHNSNLVVLSWSKSINIRISFAKWSLCSH